MPQTFVAVLPQNEEHAQSSFLFVALLSLHSSAYQHPSIIHGSVSTLAYSGECAEHTSATKVFELELAMTLENRHCPRNNFCSTPWYVVYNTSMVWSTTWH